jgi:hypothetical protein
MMQFISTSKTVKEFREELVHFIQLRAELERSATTTTASKTKKEKHLHSHNILISLADDIRFMKIQGEE